MVSISRIREAQALLARYLPRTPLVSSPALDELLRCHVFLKLETCSPVGSFRARGAFVTLSAWLEAVGNRDPRSRRRPRVVTASSGNHGFAVAYAARVLGAEATVYVAKNAPATKVEAIKREGAALVRAGQDFDEAKSQARDYALEGGGWWLEDGEDPNITAGTGTIGLEIVDDLPEVDEIIVPVGNGALIGGIGSAVRTLNPSIEITGVQPE